MTQKQQELDQAKTQYADGMQQLQDGRAQYEAGKTAFEAGKPEAEQKIAEGEAALEQIQAGIDTCNNGLEALKDMCGNDESIYGNPDTEIGAQYAGLVQPVSYTHLDVYKRQFSIWAHQTVSFRKVPCVLT